MVRVLKSTANCSSLLSPEKQESQDSLGAPSSRSSASEAEGNDATSEKQNARRPTRACVLRGKMSYGFFGVADATGEVLAAAAGGEEGISVLRVLVRPGLFSAATTSFVKS